MLRPLILLFTVTVSPALMSAQDRSFALVFGPALDAQSSPAASAIAPRVYEWLQASKTELELRRPGIRVGQELVKFTNPDAVAQAIADAAKSGRETDAQRFLDSLDLTVFSLGRRSGSRYLVDVLDSPALNDDQANRVQQTPLETCKRRQIKVLLLDLSAPGLKTPAIWKSLAEDTGSARPGGTGCRGPSARSHRVHPVLPGRAGQRQGLGLHARRHARIAHRGIADAFTAV